MARHTTLSVLIGALLAAATVALLPGHGETSGWSVPFSPALAAPTGDRPVGVRHHIVTTASPDPWNESDRRAVMVDLHYPAEADDHPLSDYYRANYMSELAMLEWQPDAEDRLGLPDGAVNWAFRVHAHEWAPSAREPMPVVVLSSPPGSMRTQFTQLAEDLASHGFLVVTVDHPHDAPEVELFPTREVVSDDDVTEVPRPAVDRLRLEDLEHVVRHLDRIDPELAPYVDETRVGLIGWLGASATQARRLGALPDVRAVVALAPFASAARTAGLPHPLVLDSTPVAAISDDATLLHQIAANVAGVAGPADGPSARARLAAAVARVRAHFQQHLGLEADGEHS